MEWFRTRRTIPKSWQVWLAAYRGKLHGAAYEGFNVPDQYSMVASTWPLNREKPSRKITRHKYKGVSASIVIGYLTIKVFGIRRLRIVDPRPQLFVKVVPSKRRVRWPPKLVIDDATLLDFFTIGLLTGKSGIAGIR
ncbi:MAG: hypothetical protein BZY75_02115 [SAR202 cluster bacterium Io17-Chloro-G7]|nr:MAG: hypothetical protein BZY75_02115 [SAR202 cluster bacterium Io17-Chloro-G7]